MKNFTTFNEWITSIKENEVTTPPVSTPIQNISNDIDVIINSLETLANELSEDLNSMQLDEAGTTDFIAAWITSMRASNAQKKVNKIKINSADLEFAAKKAEGDKKQALEDKIDLVKDQASELQKMVDDRFKGKGTIVDRKLAKAKIEGQLELIKRTSGMEDDPSKKTDLKTKMMELSNRYKEEQEAISKLEDENKEVIEAEKERLRKEAEKKKGDAETTSDTEETIEVKKIKDKIKEYQDAVDILDAKDKKSKDDLNKIDMLKNAISSEQRRLEKVESPKESLFIDAIEHNLYELASDIWNKHDWQFENNSTLFLKYSNIIKLEECNIKLNEGYSNLSIKERFSKLV